jgi:cytoskeletal protein CcmA (bactofilin family)
MLKRRKKKLAPGTTDTLVGEGSVFEGRIRSEASLRIEGQVNGDIDCLGDVTIGEGGHARSNVSARHVTVAGAVTGNVNATGALLITSTGKVIGNVTALSLIIEEGGIFEGQSRMQAPAGEDESADGPAAGPSASSGES